MSQYTNRPPERYQIRHFRPGDQEQIVSLHDSVFGREWGHDWFEWKFKRNPYVDHVPIIVSTRGDQIVGCRAFFALEMQINGTTQTALQPCDTMVHPDHRRQGLFSRMNELALEYYADRSPAFFFNFPNENSKRGNLKHGWQEVRTVPMYYRVHDPIPLLKTWIDGDGSGKIDSDERSGADASIVANVLSSAETSSERESDGVRVERYETPPHALLASIGEQESTTGIRANRSAEFYRWRLDNPASEYAAYVATRDGTALAALLVSVAEDCVQIVDILSRNDSARQGVVGDLVSGVIGAHSDRNYFTAFGESLPNPLRRGFYPDTRFPLSTIIRPTTRTLLARDIGDSTLIENSSPADWQLTQLDLDTA
ncbi:GNAT family N-acetyltransferase [Natrialbaceae archaeon A-arb3/5]